MDNSNFNDLEESMLRIVMEFAGKNNCSLKNKSISFKNYYGVSYQVASKVLKRIFELNADPPKGASINICYTPFIS